MLRHQVLLIYLSLSLFADTTYEKAMAYLNGDIGAKEIEKVKPHCPYERCEDGSTFKYIKKDTKKGYALLKEASFFDERAAMKGLRLLKKQLDYKNSSYDNYLLVLLKDNYGITSKKYDEDARHYLKVLLNSKSKGLLCIASFSMYEAHKFGHFGIEKSKVKSIQMKTIAIKNCAENTYEYVFLQ